METQLLNKKLKIFLDDGRSIVQKDGVCINQSNSIIYISTEKGIEVFPYGRIIRIEVRE